MIAINQIAREIETLPTECLQEIMDYIDFLKLKQMKKIPEIAIPFDISGFFVEKRPEAGDFSTRTTQSQTWNNCTMILSEKVLAKDWDTKEEDEAWADL